TIFWSSYVQSDDYGVFTVCMLFFLPFVVNERPVKLFLQLSFVVLISSILSFLIKEPFYAISDMIHAFVAAMAGYMVSYTKNRQVLEELITTNKLEKANAELEYLNTVDVLTGIYNRKKIFSILDTLKVTSKEEEKVLSCAILDLDNFKTINDTYGHPVGDRILKAAGVIFKEIADTHQEVSVGRIGGEEFMLLGIDLKKEEFAEICCEIKQKIYGLTIKGEQDEELFRASVSCGFCVLNGMQSSQLYHYADKALYYAKNHGKNCIWYYSVEEDEYFNYM
ncbi:MAG: GGDEF domain-containing protein, partial [Lachnospiraceae bacterium]